MVAHYPQLIASSLILNNNDTPCKQIVIFLFFDGVYKNPSVSLTAHLCITTVKDAVPLKSGRHYIILHQQ